LQQYAAMRHNQAYKTNRKDSWNSSNNNLNYHPLVVTFQHRILCIKNRELNLQALAQRQENSDAACIVFPSCADLVAPPALPVLCQARIHRTPKPP
jgi:hypothetical protein